MSTSSGALARLRLLLTPAASTPSILPFIPRPIKWILLLVLLLNVKSWPMVWHLRVFLPLVKIRIVQLKHKLTFASKKTIDSYYASLLPIGENPLMKEVVWRSSATPDDCDYNLHLSNSSYPQRLDSARFQMALKFFPSFLKEGGTLALGGTSFNFLREIPMNSVYEIRLRLAAWDQKWLYIVGQYAIPPPKMSREDLAKDVTEALKKNDPPVSSSFAPNLTGTPSTPLASDTPDRGNTAGNNQRRRQIVLPDGWILACTSISLVCCKYGRSTVPPSLALAADGFLMTKNEWSGGLQRMRKRFRSVGGGPRRNELQMLLKGEWRDKVKIEGADSEGMKVGEGIWWEDLMKREGVMASMEERLKVLSKVREALEGAPGIIDL